jgi:Transposase
LDVHRDTVVACARIMSEGRIEQHVETFGTTTSELLGLLEWLSRHRLRHVAMEATGVYWTSVWHVLEGHFELVLANAMHIKKVPGRKTDVNDAMWIADLLAHGLIRGSFVAPTPIQELRGLTRTRKQLVREKASHVQRIDKVLQDANVKLGSVLSDIMGASGRAILEAIVRGQSAPERLVELAGVRAGRDLIVEALRGRPSGAPSFSAEASSGAGRRARYGHRRGRPGGGRIASSLSRRRRAAEEHSRGERHRGGCDRFRDRSGHVAFCDAGSSDLVGGARPACEKELPGSRRCWCKPPGLRRARRARICGRNFCV